jgi:hypothetical protein
MKILQRFIPVIVLFAIGHFYVIPLYYEQKEREAKLPPGLCEAVAYGYDTLNVYGVDHEEHVKYLKALNSSDRDSVLNAVGSELIQSYGPIPVGTRVNCKLVVVEGVTLVQARYQLPQMLRRYDSYFEIEAFHIRND